jgi:hypothetical protein
MNLVESYFNLIWRGVSVVLYRRNAFLWVVVVVVVRVMTTLCRARSNDVRPLMGTYRITREPRWDTSRASVSSHCSVDEADCARPEPARDCARPLVDLIEFD